jgi:hypothetical protein
MDTRPHRSGLVIPTSAQIHEKTPKFLCTLCDWHGFEGEYRAYERHVLEHARNGDAREHSLHLKAPGLFDPNFEGSDVEWGQYLDRKMKADPHNWAKWMKTSDGKSGGGLGDG